MELPTQTSDLHQQINTWKGEVDTVRQDLRQLRGRLEQIVHQQKNPERLAQVERFQNQFIRQLEVADEMFHDLKQTAKKISHNGYPPIIHDDRPVDDYDTLHDRMQTFQKLYVELKNEFDQFCGMR